MERYQHIPPLLRSKQTFFPASKLFHIELFIIITAFVYYLFTTSIHLSLNWFIVLLATLIHIYLLKLSVSYSKNIINPMTIFLCVILYVYFFKFFLIESFPNTSVNFISRHQYQTLFYRAILYIIIGSLSFTLGYKCKLLDSIIVSIPRLHFNHFELKILKFLVFLSLIFGILGCLIIIENRGGIFNAILSLGDFRIAKSYKHHSFFDIISDKSVLLVIPSLIFIASFYSKFPRERILVIFTIIFVLFLILSATGSRSSTFSILIAIYILYQLKSLNSLRINNYRLLTYSFLLFLLFVILIHAIGIFRNVTSVVKPSDNLYNIYQERILYHYQNPSVSIKSLANGPEGLISALILIPDIVKPSFGYTFFQALLIPFPSSLLPLFKVSEQTIGNLIASYIAPSMLGGYAISIYGLFYFMFLLPGIIVLSVLFGLLSRFIYFLLLTLTNSHYINISIYSYIIGTFYVEFARSGGMLKLSDGFFFVISYFLFVAITCKIVSKISYRKAILV